MPREIMRLVSVTIPAPVTTPRIPSSGLVEVSAGIAAATARAISTAVGRSVLLEAAIYVLAHSLVRTVAITESPGQNCDDPLERTLGVI
jgi:hypothetical protein